jgi:uncharacterized protein (TIGR00255 family)
MKSMTGYSKIEGMINHRRCVVEIKTVNHRFCDINLKIPKGFASLELSIKKYLGARIARGRVDATILMENEGNGQCCVDVNIPLVKEYYAILLRLKKELNLSDDISLLHLLSLKDLFSIENIEEDFHNWDDLQALLNQALNALDAMREFEGSALKEDLLQRSSDLARYVSEIESFSGQMTEACREKLLNRFEQLNVPFEIDEPRLLTEVFLLVERGDINEEIVRVKSHLRQCAELFETHTPIGRKLDFVCQEIFRELNTIGSKSGDTNISHAVVEAKSELEKMREQVQNVE